MDQYQHADHVDCLMQPLPVFTSKSAHHAVGRSRCESRQTEQRHKTKCQAVSVNNFARDFTPVEKQVKSIKGEMGGGIGKGTTPIIRRTSRSRLKRRILLNGLTASATSRNMSAQSPVRWIRLVIGRASSLIVSES